MGVANKFQNIGPSNNRFRRTLEAEPVDTPFIPTIMSHIHTMEHFLHLAESSTIRPISAIVPSSDTEWVAVFDDGRKLCFGGKNDNRKQRFMTTLVQKYGPKKVAEFSRKYPLEFAV